MIDSSTNSVVWGSRESAVSGDLLNLASILAKAVAAELGTSLGHYYDHPRFNPMGSPKFLASPELIETVGALRRLDIPTALAASERLVEAFPNEPDALVLRSEILLSDAMGAERTSPKVKRWEESLAAINRVDPDNPWDEVMIGNRLDGNPEYGDDHNEQANRLFDEVLARDDLTSSARARVLVWRGQLFRHMEDYSAALLDLEEALRLAPTYEFTYSELSAALEDLHRYDEALERARQAVALNPASFYAQSYLASALMQNGKLEEALDHGRLAVKLGPDNHQNHWILGQILEQLEQWTEASYHFGRACRLSQDQSWCAYRAFMLQNAGLENEAREAAKEAVTLPEKPAGIFYLAFYSANAGDRTEALRYLRRVLEVVEHPFLADFSGSQLSSLHGDPEFEKILAEVKRRSLAAARQAVADEPDSWKARHDLGNLLSNLEKWPEAVDAFAQSCELGETQDPCAHHAYALHRAGRDVEAREAGKRASAMKDELWSTYHLACYYALAGERAEALQLLRRSLELGYADEHVAENPDLSFLHGDPEFESIVARMNRRTGASDPKASD